MSTNLYGPVEAALRNAMNTLGKLQIDINSAHP